jgi:flagellar biosynthesis GTPase FlhF
MKTIALIAALCLPVVSWAGVYKCTDNTGTHYQSSPCDETSQAREINTKTHSQTDLTAEEQKAKAQAEQQKQQEAQAASEKQSEQSRIDERNKQAKDEDDKTQALMKQRAKEFSAYAIPAYNPDKLPETVKPLIERLPDIERLRRVAAEKALATGQCERVEDDQLSGKSTATALVFLISCSSAKNFTYTETELK